jgi:hypothetical protein
MTTTSRSHPAPGSFPGPASVAALLLLGCTSSGIASNRSAYTPGNGTCGPKRRAQPCTKGRSPKHANRTTGGTGRFSPHLVALLE